MTQLSWRGWLLAGVAGVSVIAQLSAWPSLVGGFTAPDEPTETLWALLSALHLACSLWALALVGALGAGRLPARFAPAALIALCVAAPPAAAETTEDRSDTPLTSNVESSTTDSPPAAVDLHEVDPGDTLWDIASHHLPPDASNAEIAQAVHRWHDDNRAVIGDDPDVIQPGQVFGAPQEVPVR